MADLARETGEGPAVGPAWDPIVRLTHWLIALAILLNGLITEGGEAPHVWIGYAVAALLALRLLWGGVGPEEARFSAFPPSLSAARAHAADLMAGRRRPHRSHNPLGALNVYAIWAVMAVVVATGIAMETDPLPGERGETVAQISERLDRAAARHDDDEAGEHGERGEGGEALEEVHEIAANLLLILAGLHVAGVAVETRRLKIDLVAPMLGRRGREG